YLIHEQGRQEIAGYARDTHPTDDERVDPFGRGQERGRAAQLEASTKLASRGRNHAEHRAPVDVGNDGGVVERGQIRPAHQAGFSASSISITGMSSRTG